MKINILNNEYCNVTVTSKSGESVSRMMSIKTLIAALSRKEDSIESTFMAPGIFKVKESPREAVYYMLMESRIVNITFASSGGDRFSIRVPRTVWAFTYSKGSKNVLTNTKVYLLADDDEFNENTPLYIFPFNNFSYGYTPGVCWGTSESAIQEIFKNEINTFKFDSMYRMYFGMPFNNDLGNDCYSCSRMETIMHNNDWDINRRIFSRLYGWYEYLRFLAENPHIKFDPSRISNNALKSTISQIML